MVDIPAAAAGRSTAAGAPAVQDRFRGCLLGLAIGDALGGRFEAQTGSAIRARYPDVKALVSSPVDDLWYTDDTQMAIGVAETLIAAGGITEGQLCRAFVGNYMPARGYGRGARAVLEAMEGGHDYREVAARYFPGGSYGNGAAMRVAPVGLFFRDDEAALLEHARRSALPTHLHPLGIEGARLVALGVALAARSAAPLDREAFFASLEAACRTPEFRERLAQARQVRSPQDLAGLGNGIAALDSVPTALASFALSPGSYDEATGNVILLGGDTDTLAAMAGALSGAHLGTAGLPARLVELLEPSPKGRDYLFELADRLYGASLAAAGSRGERP